MEDYNYHNAGGYYPDRYEATMAVMHDNYWNSGSMEDSRYAQYRGALTGAAANLNGYKDAGQISGWATEAMAWAAAEGLINGRTATTIAPKGTATRAEVAAMLQRFSAQLP